MDEKPRKKVAERMEEQAESPAYRLLTGREKPAQTGLTGREKPAQTGLTGREKPAQTGQAPSSNNLLTMEKVLEADEKLRKVAEKPFRKLLRDEGFDEDLDWILIPDRPELSFMSIPPSLQHRVKKHPNLTTVLLMRKPTWPLHFVS